MLDGGQPIRGHIRHLWEALFSLHLGFAAMTMVFIANPALDPPFSRMETRINVFLHIRQTDYVRGYFSIWVPSVLVSLLIWVVLRTFARTRFIQGFLRSLAGIVTIFTPMAFWVFLYEHTSRPVGCPWEEAAFEMAAALIFTLLFLLGKWQVPAWASLLLLAAHYVFWYFTPSSDPAQAGYGGPSGPILGFCAAAAWGLYVSRLRKENAVGAPLVG